MSNRTGSYTCLRNLEKLSIVTAVLEFRLVISMYFVLVSPQTLYFKILFLISQLHVPLQQTVEKLKLSAFQQYANIEHLVLNA